MFRLRFVSGVALAVALSIAGAVQAAPPLMRDLGGVKLGESGDSATAVLGKPTEVSGDFALPENVAPSGGVIYKLSDEAQVVLLVGRIFPMEARIVQISVQGEPGEKTRPFNVDGIGLGATEQAVKQKFGAPDREIVHEGTPMKSIAYKESNVAFAFFDGKVASISVLYRNQMMFDDIRDRSEVKPVDIWLDLGDMRVRGAQYESAEECFLKALELEPKNNQAKLKLGGVYYVRGEWDKAETSFKEVLAVEPNNALATYNLARVNIRKKNLAEGRRLLTRTITLDPSSAAAYNELGLLDEIEKKLDEAERSFRKAAELAPNSSGPRQNIARILLVKGDKKGAIDQYSEALRMELRDQTPDPNAVRSLREILNKLREETASEGSGVSPG